MDTFLFRNENQCVNWGRIMWVVRAREAKEAGMTEDSVAVVGGRVVPVAGDPIDGGMVAPMPGGYVIEKFGLCATY